jgi:hypothetical protein
MTSTARLFLYAKRCVIGWLLSATVKGRLLGLKIT